MSEHADIVERACGFREQGGIYWELGTSPNGRSIWDFLFCPPRLVDILTLGITPLGTHLIADEHGVYHVFDVIGKEFYPNPMDWVQETRRYGVSRKLNPLMDFSKLTADSKLIMLHEHAYIHNGSDYFAHMPKWKPKDWNCPKGVPEHERPRAQPGDDDCCLRLWFFDYTLDKGMWLTEEKWCGQQVAHRQMATFAFDVALRPAGVEPDYGMAMIGAFPLSRLAVVKDQIAQRHNERAKAARKSGLPVEVVDQ